MEKTVFLPGDHTTRIRDLLKKEKISQVKLAKMLDVSEATISRFMKGTHGLPFDKVMILADVLHVSADFLAGKTTIPDRKNYDVTLLELSEGAIKNIHSGKVNVDIVNKLLESPRFAQITYMVRNYLDNDLASGIAAQNQLYTSLMGMMAPGMMTTEGNPIGASMITNVKRDLNLLKQPLYQADLEAIKAQFENTLKELKRDHGDRERLEQSAGMTKEIVENMIQNTPKGSEVFQLSVTPEMIVDGILQQLQSVANIPEDELKEFGTSFQKIMNRMMDLSNLQIPDSVRGTTQ